MLQFNPLQHSTIPTVIQMMEAFYKLDNYDFDSIVATKLFSEFIENENLGKCWLIFAGEELVGYAVLTFIFSFEYKGKIASLDELFIAEKFRGKGYGNETLDFIAEQTKVFNLKLIYLEVEPHNDAAQKLYLSKGFDFHKRNLMKFKI